ncbi:MAG: hypothetical protein HRU36_01090, partial [Rickettsiales bacterium]|nr:hypothetical protein [Rickettsiales bacterium]
EEKRVKQEEKEEKRRLKEENKRRKIERKQLLKDEDKNKKKLRAELKKELKKRRKFDVLPDKIAKQLKIANRFASSSMLLNTALKLPIGRIVKFIDKYTPDTPDSLEVRAIKENPSLLLESSEFQELVTNQELWKNILKLKTKVATRIIKELKFPEDKELRKAVIPLAENIVSNATQLFLNKELMQNILQNAAVVIDPKKSDIEKMNSLTEILQNSKDFVAIATSPEVWKLIEHKKSDIAALAVSNLNIPEGQQKEMTELFEDLIQTASVISKDQSRELIQNIVNNLSVIIDPKQDEVTKIKQSFELMDQAIQFVDSNKEILESLRKHEKTITKMLAPHMPPGIKPEKVVNDILLNEKTFSALKTAYSQYKDNKYHALGVIQAITTIVKSSEIRNLATTIVLNGVVSIMPDFIRRSYINETTIDDILANKDKKSNDLAKLCEESSINTNFITKYSLNGRCLKGLKINHDLSDLTIKGFNFSGASLGSTDNSFSFANSKISKTDFSNVQLEGKQIDISGIEIDGESFVTLIDSLEKCTEVKIDKPIKITELSDKLQKKIMDSKFYKEHTDKFELAPVNAKSTSKEIVPDKKKPSLTLSQKMHKAKSFVQKLHEARNKVQQQSKKR